MFDLSVFTACHTHLLRVHTQLWLGYLRANISSKILKMYDH